MSTKIKPLVSICCLVYNHGPYLRDCFEGFVKQQTTFPFEILVHDDASTDHSADIIREYTAKYPHLFKPIYQTENQYSKGIRVTNQYQYPRAQGKYIALCEGDDYWTNPDKLQMQVDWLEAHSDYSMCCSNAYIQSSTRTLSGARYWKDCDIPTVDMIMGRGCFVQTCTLVFRKSLLDSYPAECKNCHVGDYPLQIWAVLNGKARYFKTKTGVYRRCYQSSWTVTHKQISIDLLMKGIRSELTMLQALDLYSNHRYHPSFIKIQTNFILEEFFFHARVSQKKDLAKVIFSFFPELSKSLSFSQKNDIFIVSHFPFFIYKVKRIISQTLKVVLQPNSRNLFDFYQKIQETIQSS